MTPSTLLSRRGLLALAGGATAGSALLDPAWFQSEQRLDATVVDDAWSMARRDPGRTGFVARGPSKAAEVAWTRRLGRPPTGLGLAVAAGRVYTAAWDTLVALDASDGTTEWEFTPALGRLAGNVPLETPPVATDAGVFVGSEEGFYALDRAGGRRWRYETDSRSDGVLVVGTTVFLSAEQGSEPLVALDTESGLPRWRRESTPVLPQAFADGAVVGAAQEGWNADVGAVSARTGRTRWTRSFDETRVGTPTPTVVGGTVLFGSETLSALALDDGSTRWRYRLGTDDTAGPVTDGETAYVVAGDSVVALDVASGSRRWRRVVDGLNARCPPVVTSETLYAGAEEGIVALDTATGDERFRITVEGLSPSSLAFVAGALYVADETTVVALREGAQ